MSCRPRPESFDAEAASLIDQHVKLITPWYKIASSATFKNGRVYLYAKSGQLCSMTSETYFGLMGVKS